MTDTTGMDRGGFRADFDADTGVATLWMQMAGRANKINADFGEGFSAALDDALAFEGLKGVIVASGHRDFCVGADLDFVYAAREPGPLLAALQILDVAPGRALFVGDSGADEAAARAAGVDFRAVAWGHVRAPTVASWDALLELLR